MMSDRLTVVRIHLQALFHKSVLHSTISCEKQIKYQK